jgi:hypothetical protein
MFQALAVNSIIAGGKICFVTTAGAYCISSVLERTKSEEKLDGGKATVSSFASAQTQFPTLAPLRIPKTQPFLMECQGYICLGQIFDVMLYV